MVNNLLTPNPLNQMEKLASLVNPELALLNAFLIAAYASIYIFFSLCPNPKI